MSPKTSLLLLAALASFAVGACFNGLDSRGLPCDDDAQCGPSLACINNFCGNSFLCGDGKVIEAEHVCDLELNCPDGSDESFELCFDSEGESFDCASGLTIPFELVCNADPDCEDGDDEDAYLCAGVGVNQCETSPDGDLAYALGPSHEGAPMPMKVEATQLVGPPLDELLVASENGDFIKIVSFNPMDGSAQETLLNGPASFGGATIVDWELGDVNGDDMLDIVVATAGDSTAVYVFENLAPGEPMLFGPTVSLPDVLNPEVRSMKLGRLNNDSSIDVVFVVDGTINNGQIYAGLGDSSAPPDGSYFSPVLAPTSALDYDTFFDADMADVDGNTFDDLIVSGLAGGVGKVWIIKRSGADVMAWDEPTEMDLPFPATEIALARLGSMAPNVDLVALDGPGGRIRTFPNQGGMFMMGGQTVTLEGSQISGLTLADMNCDGLADFLFNVVTPAEVRVMLGDGMGGLADAPIVFASQGHPRGGLAVSHFDGDSTPDIAAAIDGDQGVPPEVRILQTEVLLQ